MKIDSSHSRRLEELRVFGKAIAFFKVEFVLSLTPYL